MQPASTKLYQRLSPMPYTGHFIFSYMKGEKTEIEREQPRLKLIKNSALQQTGLKHISVLFAKLTHGFVFVLFCIYIFNKCPCKKMWMLFPTSEVFGYPGHLHKTQEGIQFPLVLNGSRTLGKSCTAQSHGGNYSPGQADPLSSVAISPNSHGKT